MSRGSFISKIFTECVDFHLLNFTCLEQDMLVDPLVDSDRRYLGSIQTQVINSGWLVIAGVSGNLSGKPKKACQSRL